MFAFSYNKRTTFGENTVESAWTISKLSSTLSWFERFTSLEEVLDACVRRSLSYPLYRYWELSCKVLQDVKDIFKLGRRKILKCLLEILMLFNESEPRYLLNELYITDYCIWLQKVKERKIESLAKKLLETEIRKESIGWDLKELETAAILVYNEEKDHTADSESSSSEYSTEDDDEETESNDSTDGDSTEVEEEMIQQNAIKCSEKASLCEGELEHGEKGTVYQTLRVLNTKQANLSVRKNETDSENEKFHEVEVLPSLFPKQQFGGKDLVEIIGGDEDDNNTVFAVEAEKSGINRTINEGEKEIVLTGETGEQDLSCKISRLVIK
ncbi:Hypothetical predicted protein [Paramuricea clavata]|uniref:Protein SHQ1 homolog n=1 Tax=Paramuricea clavata TaxID=317549 RepID=A0A7D9HXM6_PARCT|nr:Hypothetical predicted protein [Paramuricea clavata]